MFKLDNKLQEDTFFVHNFEISSLLLMNDANYLWLILVPRKANLVELIDLELDVQEKILKEINIVAKILKSEFKADKINIANLGNIVKQLHIHVIGRYNNDISFPKPVWGAFEAKPYKEKEANDLILKIQSFLK